MLAEHFHLSLDGAQIPIDTGILELPMQFTGGHLAAARNTAQQLDGKQYGFECVGALCHLRPSMPTL